MTRHIARTESARAAGDHPDDLVADSIQEKEERMWVCHECQMIGSEEEADRHMIDTGHATQQLSADLTKAVREEQRNQQAQRVAAFISYARPSPQEQEK